MTYPKDANGDRVPSQKQRAVLLYGQRLRGLGNVGELVRHLKLLGHHKAAELVIGASRLLKSSALKEYESERKRLDPSFKDADDRFWDMIFNDRREQDERDTTSKTS